jgi:hypothetical protein
MTGRKDIISSDQMSGVLVLPVPFALPQLFQEKKRQPVVASRVFRFSHKEQSGACKKIQVSFFRIGSVVPVEPRAIVSQGQVQHVNRLTVLALAIVQVLSTQRLQQPSR